MRDVLAADKEPLRNVSHERDEVKGAPGNARRGADAESGVNDNAEDAEPAHDAPGNVPHAEIVLGDVEELFADRKELAHLLRAGVRGDVGEGAAGDSAPDHLAELVDRADELDLGDVELHLDVVFDGGARGKDGCRSKHHVDAEAGLLVPVRGRVVGGDDTRAPRNVPRLALGANRLAPLGLVRRAIVVRGRAGPKQIFDRRLLVLVLVRGRVAPGRVRRRLVHNDDAARVLQRVRRLGSVRLRAPLLRHKKPGFR